MLTIFKTQCPVDVDGSGVQAACDRINLVVAVRDVGRRANLERPQILVVYSDLDVRTREKPEP